MSGHEEPREEEMLIQDTSEFSSEYYSSNDEEYSGKGKKIEESQKETVQKGFRKAVMEVDESKVSASPEERWIVNEFFCMRWFFFWFFPYLFRGFFKSPTMQDLPRVSKHAKCEFVEQKFDYIWPKLKGFPFRFLLAVNYCFGIEFWLAGLIQLVATVSQVFLPKIMELFLKQLYLPLEEDSTELLDNMDFLRSILPKDSEVYPPPNSDFVRKNNYMVWVYLFLLALVYILNAWGMNYSIHISTRVGMKVRTVMVTKIYQKSLLLSNKARGKYENGIILNHVGMDALKLERIHMFLHLGWTSWIMLFGSIYFLADLIGWGALTGTLTNFVVIPVVVVIMIMFLIIRILLVKTIDKRVNKTNEVLQSIRIIKYFAWEDSFLKKISRIRMGEILLFRVLSVLISILISVLVSLTSIVCLVAFLTYYFVNGYLDAISVFASLTYFNMMRMPLAFAPMIIIMVMEMIISMGRIGKLLEAGELEELDEMNNDDNRKNSKKKKRRKFPIIIEGGKFRWEVTKKNKGKEGKGGKNNDNNDEDDKKGKNKKLECLKKTCCCCCICCGTLICKKILKRGKKESEGGGGSNKKRKNKLGYLEDINLEIKKGSLVMVVGEVGSGKSSLLYAILGEMKRLEGNVQINGRFSYTSQLSWIQNSTLYENVVFGEPCGNQEEAEEKWKEIVECCQLQQDLEELKGGKEIEIGEKGINLSGGQKYRVQLARACYTSSDIVLLDDPMAAVDAHVGKKIFEKCITGYLDGRTRVLVTHQLNYLEFADWVVLMDEGRIVEQGKYRDLMSNEDGKVCKLVSEYVEEKKEEEVDKDDDDSKKVDDSKKKKKEEDEESEGEDDDEKKTKEDEDDDNKEKTEDDNNEEEVEKQEIDEDKKKDDDDPQHEILFSKKVDEQEDENDEYAKNEEEMTKLMEKSKLESKTNSKRRREERDDVRKKNQKKKKRVVVEEENKIIASEEMKRGLISPKVLWVYIYSMGCCGLIPLLIILSVYTYTMVIQIATDVWLSDWADGRWNEKFSNMYHVGLYATMDKGVFGIHYFDLMDKKYAYSSIAAYNSSYNTSSTNIPTIFIDGNEYYNCTSLSSRLSLKPVQKEYFCPSPTYGACGCTDFWIPIMWDRKYDNGTKIEKGLSQVVSVIIYASLGFLSLFNMFVRTVIFMNFMNTAAQTLHNRAIKRVLAAPMSFFDTTPIGRIIARFSHDITQVDGQLINSLTTALGMGFRCIGTFFIICYNTDGVGAVFVIPLLVLYILFYILYRKTNLELKRLESVSKTPILSHISETLNGMPTIRAYRAKDRFIKELRRRIDMNNRSYFLMMSAQRWLGLYLGLLGCVFVLSVCIVLVIIYHYWTDIDLGIAYVSLAVSYSITSTQMFFKVVEQVCEAEVMMNSVERLDFYARNIPVEAPFEQNLRRSKDFVKDGNISFINYSMRYRKGLDLVLKSLNFTMLGNERIGIVGRTGSGKSSLMVALWRLVEPARGRIEIDGININDLNLVQLRNALSIIPQDATLFSGTVRFNLDPFSQYKDKEIWEALRKSFMSKKIKTLPGKLKYNLKEGGSNFSVGERQLLCLARALLRKARILVMDEATASVDIHTDSKIQKTIRESFSNNCTSLTIAHRLETIIDCDKILVMHEGRVAEFDTPRNLLEKTDEYYLFRDLVRETGEATESLLYDYAFGRKVLEFEDIDDEEDKILKDKLVELEMEEYQFKKDLSSEEVVDDSDDDDDEEEEEEEGENDESSSSGSD